MEPNERFNPRTLYFHISDEFVKLLDVLGAGFSERKEGIQKHKVTLKNFRSFVYTTISTVDYEYAEWFLGHSKSVYWRKKEPERREIYRNKCMKHLFSWTLLCLNSGVEVLREFVGERSISSRR